MFIVPPESPFRSSTLRAFVINEFGQPGSIAEVVDPTPAEGELLIRVKAASVNPMDAFAASGGTAAWADTRLPFIPGLDAAGVIEQVGRGVSGLEPGTEVVGNAGTKPFWGAGTFAELVALPAAAVTTKPAHLDPATASALPQAGLTALAAFENLDLGAGQSVLVVGATGGVGGYFTSLAASQGAVVAALARPENADYARRMGATAVFDYTSADVEAELRAAYPGGLDALADFSGNAELVGRLAGLLRAGGGITSSAAGMLDGEGLAARGFAFSPANRADLARLPELIALLGTEARPEIRTVPFDQAGTALAEVGAGHTRGKVVLTIS
jgi:NADPH:quinone reductase-like Zn-dependent oxidoreductase